MDDEKKVLLELQDETFTHPPDGDDAKAFDIADRRYRRTQDERIENPHAVKCLTTDANA